MRFKKSREYPDGAIEIVESDFKKLKAKGWIIDLHTPYYSNFIGIKSLDMEFGFGSWNLNLEFHITAKNEYGGYYTPTGYDFKINSSADLKKAIAIVDNMIALEKIFKSLTK